jgi:hypothetical protein
LGQEVEAVLEASRKPNPHVAVGVADNYLKLRISFPNQEPPPEGSAIRCRICGFPEWGEAFSRFDALGEYIKDKLR